jgi:hypothetical protein
MSNAVERPPKSRKPRETTVVARATHAATTIFQLRNDQRPSLYRNDDT